MRVLGFSAGRWRLLAGGIVVLLASSAANGAKADGEAPAGALEALVARAEAGDAEAQNRLAVALFTGAGLAADPERAHVWLHRAAEAGHPAALANLGYLHATGAGGLAPDYAEANMAFATSAVRGLEATAPPDPAGLLAPDFDPADAGGRVFATFCAGCHGFGGLAAFPLAPSFALGERLAQDDPTLLRSVLNGKGSMPAWGGKLADEALAGAIGYMRSLRFLAEHGLTPEGPPEGIAFHRFPPAGDSDRDWWYYHDTAR